MDTGPRVHRDAIEAELERLCISGPLRRASVHARLLRYVVGRALDGDRLALSETAIAIAVFERDPARYDPHADPIVRVAMSRLRARLRGCYDGDGAARPLRIVVPRGEYAPRFVTEGTLPRPFEPVLLRPACNATGERSHDRLCSRAASAMRVAIDAAGVARTAQPADASTRVDTVLSRDAGGALRLTVRAIDPLDGAVRWIETFAASPLRLADVQTLATRVAARFATGRPDAHPAEPPIR